ncbi:MAG: hypothetical protein ACRD9L_21510, partial [Bryobacteraceae bacterium]
MAKSQSIDELLRATRHASAPATRDSVVRQSLGVVSSGLTASLTNNTGTLTAQTRSLPPSLPGVIVATGLGGGQGATADSGASSPAAANNLSNQLQQISTQLTQVQSTNQSAIDSTAQNTQALLQNTQTKSQGSGSSALGTIGSTLLNVFGGGLSPIITGLTSLFTGGGSSTPQPLTPYVLPRPIQFQAGISGANGQIASVDQNSNGTVRPMTSSSQPAPQVTVQVQTIDSQSFLDHSGDIANAVRQA